MFYLTVRCKEKQRNQTLISGILILIIIFRYACVFNTVPKLLQYFVINFWHATVIFLYYTNVSSKLFTGYDRKPLFCFRIKTVIYYKKKLGRFIWEHENIFSTRFGGLWNWDSGSSWFEPSWSHCPPLIYQVRTYMYRFIEGNSYKLDYYNLYIYLSVSVLKRRKCRNSL